MQSTQGRQFHSPDSMAVLDTRQLWQNALGELQIQMGRDDFRTWFRNTSLVSIDGATCVVGVDNPFSVDWLSSKCKASVARTLQGLLGRTVEVAFVVERRPAALTPPPALTLAPPPLGASKARRGRQGPAADRLPLAIPRYTFDTFVVGDNCKLAHAASLAVAERPGESYNPLFIYGGVGLGKTHLLHAIGHAVHRRGEQVVYEIGRASCRERV